MSALRCSGRQAVTYRHEVEVADAFDELGLGHDVGRAHHILPRRSSLALYRLGSSVAFEDALQVTIAHEATHGSERAASSQRRSGVASKHGRRSGTQQHQDIALTCSGTAYWFSTRYMPVSASSDMEATLADIVGSLPTAARRHPAALAG